jgi:hypothetical protein
MVPLDNFSFKKTTHLMYVLHDISDKKNKFKSFGRIILPLSVSPKTIA